MNPWIVYLVGLVLSLLVVVFRQRRRPVPPAPIAPEPRAPAAPDATIEALRVSLADAKARHHAGEDQSATIRALATALNAALTDGARDCPDCGALPVGLLQPHAVEIGCVSCPNHRAVAPDRESAVEAWNRGAYLPPRS